MTAALILALAAAAPTLRAELDTTATAVGGPLHLTLEVSAAEGWLVEPPPPALDLGAFRVRAAERLPRPEGSAWKLRLIALEAGEAAVPAVALTAHGPEGATEEVRSEPIPVTVASNLPATAPSANGGPPEEPEPAGMKPALEAPRNWLPLIVATAAAAAAFALGFWLLRKRRLRPARAAAPAPAVRRPLRPAWEVALEELDRIAAADHVGKGELGRQYVEVTIALRRYLEDRYGVPALESTTTEVGEHLRRSPVPGETTLRILSLLREADLVKFAKARPDPETARSTEKRARDVVLATTPRPEVEEKAA